MAIQYKTPEAITLMREGATLLSHAHAAVAAAIRPGVTTAHLDSVAEAYLCDHGATPSFKGYNGFPATLCTSINDEVIHGIPSTTRTLKEGDIIAIDCGACYKGYHTDAAFTYPVGDVTKELLDLLAVTEQALYAGIACMTSQHRLGDVGHAIQHCVVPHSYRIVRTFGGHGVGAQLHEDPHVCNFGKRGQGIHLREGMVLAIEPLVNMGTKEVVEEEGTGIVRTADGKPGAHFEHTVAIVGGKPEVLTTFEPIKELLRQRHG